MKGFILFRDGQGVYVQHSVPDLIDENYPSSGFFYGQHMVCWTINEENLYILAHHLYNTHPQIEKIEVSDYFLNENSNEYLKHIAKDEFEENAVLFEDLEFFTVGGKQVDLFSVSKKKKQQLWYSITRYEQEFNMVTWRRAPLLTGEKLLQNVKEIFMDVNKEKLDCWSIRKEHSKYALSKTGDRVCFGDVNYESAKMNERTGERPYRAGGVYCFEEEILVNDLRKKLSFTPTRSGIKEICETTGEPR